MLTKGIERAKERKGAETINNENIENDISAIKLGDKKVQFPINGDATLIESTLFVQTQESPPKDLEEGSSGFENDSQASKTRCLETIVFLIKRYDDDLSIEDFSYNTAEITKRSQESASGWIKILKQNDID